MRLERRTQASRTALVAAPLAAVAVTLLICALLVAWAGAPVAKTYLLLLEGGFGSRFALTETLTRATPLILTGLAVAVAFRARLFNIGAEGQFYAGALAAVAVGGLHGGDGFGLPNGVLYVLMIIAAMAAGAVVLLVPAWLKARMSVDEVVTTLLLNFIALLFVSMLLDRSSSSAACWRSRACTPASCGRSPRRWCCNGSTAPPCSVSRCARSAAIPALRASSACTSTA